MTRNTFLRLGLGLLLLGPLSACSSSKNKNPVASNEEVGKVAEAEAKPAVYTATDGDTLRKIAGRPEIYGDPTLWPLLQEANPAAGDDKLSVAVGTQMNIPRDSSPEQLDMAKEKARQYAASLKQAQEAQAYPQPTPKAKVDKAPVVKSVVTAVPPQPVPQAKKSRILFPVLLVLLLILLALAFLLFYFMKKDRKEENPQ